MDRPRRQRAQMYPFRQCTHRRHTMWWSVDLDRDLEQASSCCRRASAHRCSRRIPRPGCRFSIVSAPRWSPTSSSPTWDSKEGSKKNNIQSNIHSRPSKHPSIINSHNNNSILDKISVTTKPWKLEPQTPPAIKIQVRK